MAQHQGLPTPWWELPTPPSAILCSPLRALFWASEDSPLVVWSGERNNTFQLLTMCGTFGFWKTNILQWNKNKRAACQKKTAETVRMLRMQEIWLEWLTFPVNSYDHVVTITRACRTKVVVLNFEQTISPRVKKKRKQYQIKRISWLISPIEWSVRLSHTAYTIK